ncbi:uncharacterized protein [Apostichopus japonicus]|uniref:uncharacterized protein isoform X3 n=1 Tax=Stichopus japonicus TaxID=307972 RepID=UPI003AB47792
MVHHLILTHTPNPLPCECKCLGKYALISLETIFGGHMMRILHRMVNNMLIVMVIQLSTFLWYISSKKVKEKVKWEHITDVITSSVDVSLDVPAYAQLSDHGK